MTTYLDMKRALLRNNTIEMYKPTARLIEMVTILACHGIVSIVSNGIDWRVTLLRKPTVNENLTVADAPAPPLAVVAPVNAANLVGTEVHLWNDYPTGKKPTMGKWKVTARLTGDWYTLEYKPTAKTVTRTRAQLCTQDEYAVYVAGVKAAA